MLFSKKFLPLLVAPLFFLTGCASVPPLPKVVAAPEALKPIKSVAVFVNPNHERYTVLNNGTRAATGMGLLGSLYVLDEKQSREKRLRESFAARDVSVTNELAKRISAQLAAAGYESTVETGQWTVKAPYTVDFEKTRVSADAVLIVTPGMIGFIAGNWQEYKADFQPTIAVGAILVGKDRNVKLYQDYHVAGYHLVPEFRRIEPTTTFPTFKDVMDDAQDAPGALYEAASKIAAAIVSDLKRN